MRVERSADYPDDGDPEDLERRAAWSEGMSELLASGRFDEDDDVKELLQAQAHGEADRANHLGRALYERLEREGR